MVSDERVHINMKMHGYLDSRPVGGSVFQDGKAVRTWMRELGFVWRESGEDGVPRVHKLHLVARRGKAQARGEGFLESATLDGTPLPRLQVCHRMTAPPLFLPLLSLVSLVTYVVRGSYIAV